MSFITNKDFGETTSKSVSGTDKVGLLGSQNAIKKVNISDPLLARYSFDNSDNPVINEHAPGTFDGISTGTSQIPGIASDSSIKLLLHMDDVGLTDSSLYNRSVTLNGNVNRSATQSKFGGYSAYFDGAGDWLEFADSSDWDISSGDFSWELWFYPESGGNSVQSLICQGEHAGQSTQINMLSYEQSNTRLRWLVRNDSGNVIDLNTPVGSISANEWYHVAMTREGTTYRIFINGLLKASAVSATAMVDLSFPLRIGRRAPVGADEYFKGYIDEVVISNTNLHPDTNKGHSSLLLQSDSTNGSSDLSGLDISYFGHSVSNSGVTHSTTQILDGHNTSLRFDTNDYVDVPSPNAKDLVHKTGEDYTLQTWVYFDSLGSIQSIYVHGTSSTVNTAVIIQVNGSSILQCFVRSGGTWNAVFIASDSALSASTWTHIRLTKTNGTWRLFIDGVVQTTTVSADAAGTGTVGDTLRIGRYTDGLYPFAGYMQDLEILQGVSLSDSSFTVDQAPLTPSREITPPTVEYTVTNDSIYGLARSFNGSSDYIELPGILTTDVVSFGCWFRVNTFTTEGRLIGRRHYPSQSRNFSLRLNTTNGLRISSNIGQFDSSTNINDGKWHHAFVTYENSSGDIKLYIDGELDTTSTMAGVNLSTYDSAIPASIGAYVGSDSSTGNFFNGDIDDVRFYNIILNDEEVQSLFKPGAKGLLDETPEVVSYEMNPLLTDQVSSKAMDFPMVVINGSIQEIVNNETIPTSATGFPTAVQDLSGLVNNSVYFNGNNYIQTTNNVNISSNAARTVSAWVYPETANSINSFVCSWGTSGSGTSFGISLSGGDIWTSLNNGSDLDVSWQHTLGLEEWSHLILTYDGTYLESYVNGVLTSSVNQGSINTTNGVLHIGESVLNSEGFVGRIDELKIFDQVLNQEEIDNLYNEGNLNGVAKKQTVAVIDSIGSGDGVINGNVKSYQNSTKYDGNTFYTSTDAALFDASEVTICCEVRRNASSGYRHIIGTADGANTEGFGVFFNTSTNKFRVVKYDTVDTGAEVNVVATEGQYFRVVFGVQSNHQLFISIYNGSSWSTFTNLGNTTAIDQGNEFFIAKGNGTQGYLIGEVRNVEFYNGVPDDPEAWIPGDTKSLKGTTLVMQSKDGSGTDNEQGFTFTKTGNPIALTNRINGKRSIGFDGIQTDYVDLSHLTEWDLSDKAFTLSFWANISTAKSGGIIGNWDDGSNKSYVIDWNGTNLRFLSSTDGSTTSATTNIDGGYVVENSWFHVTVTNNSSGTFKAFINGKKTVEISGLTIYTPSQNNAVIGKYAANTTNLPFDGGISEIKLYHRVLTNAEVELEYQLDLPTISQSTLPVNYYDMSTGTLYSSTSYDGVGDYYYSTDSALRIAGTQTWCFELYMPSSNTSSWEAILSNGINSNPRNGFLIEVDPSSGSIHAVMSIIGTSVTAVNTGVISGKKDQWVSVIMSYDGSTLSTFFDGVAGGTALGGLETSVLDFYIGNTQFSGRGTLEGSIKNIEIYSGSATNPTEWVPGDTSSLKTSSYSNTGGSGDRTGIITETHNGWGTAQLGGETASDGDKTSLAYNTSAINSSVWIQHDFGSAVSIAEAKYYFNQINNVTTWKFQASNTDGSGYVDVSASFSMNIAAKVVAITDSTPYRYWRVVGVSGTMNNWATELEWNIIYESPLIMQSRDGSGTDNEQGLTFTSAGDPSTSDEIGIIDTIGEANPTVVGSITASGRKNLHGLDMSPALYFDGTDDYVDISGRGTITVGSIAFWLKSDGYTANPMIWGTWDGAHQGYIQISTNVMTYYKPGDTATVNWGTFDTGSWHHYVLTVDGSQHKAYLDGILVDVASDSSDLTGPVSTMVIGRAASGSTNFMTGLFDEFKIYEVALTQEEISALHYNRTYSGIPSEYTRVIEPSSFYFTYNGKATSSINFQADPAEIQSSLEANPDIGVGNIQVSQLGPDSDTVLLLAFENDFSDSSNSNHTPTVFGNASISTAQSKFGNSSGAFDGSTDYVEFPDSDDWFYGSNDFTIDFWVRFNSFTSSMKIITQRVSDTDMGPTISFEPQLGDGLRFFAYQGGYFFNVAQGSNAGWELDTWYHVAMVRNGSSIKGYKDGVEVLSTTTTALPNINAPLRVGAWNSTQFSLDGYLDEVRISSVARWTSNFTPPTQSEAEAYLKIEFINDLGVLNINTLEVSNDVPLGGTFVFEEVQTGGPKETFEVICNSLGVKIVQIFQQDGGGYKDITDNPNIIIEQLSGTNCVKVINKSTTDIIDNIKVFTWS
jgi:hypothetical protein